MKTTIDIPEEDLLEAMRFTGAKTKKEAVNTALAEFNRQRKVQKVIKLFGTFKSIMTNEEIEAMDEKEQHSQFGHSH